MRAKSAVEILQHDVPKCFFGGLVALKYVEIQTWPVATLGQVFQFSVESLTNERGARGVCVGIGRCGTLFDLL